MEQARYWTWSKPTQSFYDDSWEEQAFAVDAAAGSLGGCVWPPRSYTCSFCRREFRSAQALGGHMNVHRRDRARLKQSHNSLDHDQLVLQNHLPNHSTPLDLEYPHPVRNTNPSSEPLEFRVVNKSSFPIFTSSRIEGLQENSSKFPIPSRSNLGAHNNFPLILELNNEETSKKFIGFENRKEYENFVKTDLSTSLNLGVRRKRSNSCEGEEGENINHKRQKVESASLLSFSKSNSFDRFDVQSEVLELSSSYSEELDLELNLGMGQKKNI